MNFSITSIDLDVTLAVALVVMVTLAAAFVIGLALLARPSQATIIWSLGFGVGVLGTYCFVAASVLEIAPLRALSSGLMMSFVPLVWLGLRAYNRQPVPWFSAISFVVLVPTVLPFLTQLPQFASLFRVIFLGAGIFAALIAYDLIRMNAAQRDILLPLMLASCSFVLITVLSAIEGFAKISTPGDDELAIVRDVNGIGTLVMSSCAAMTIVLLVQTKGRVKKRSHRVRQVNQMMDRLARAKTLRETEWSLLDIRLDDTDDLRLAMRDEGYARLVDSFHQSTLMGLPAHADVLRVDGARVIALLPADDQHVRHHLRSLLSKISAPAASHEAVITRISASIGWATVADVGYDYDTLSASAAKGAELAQSLGGDRWAHSAKAATTLE